MKPRRDKGRIGGPFVPLLKDTMKSDAWRADPMAPGRSMSRSKAATTASWETPSICRPAPQ